MFQRRIMEVALALLYWPLTIKLLWKYDYISMSDWEKSAYVVALAAIVFLIIHRIFVFLYMRCKIYDADKKVEYQTKMGSFRLAKDIEKKQKQFEKQLEKEQKAKPGKIVPVHKMNTNSRWPPAAQIV